MTTKAKFPAFSEDELLAMAKAMSDAATHAELPSLFRDAGLEEPADATGPAKWQRIFNTLAVRQNATGTGLGNLLIGFFGTFRNPTAHAPKVLWLMKEQDALDLLTMASFLHRRLDAAVLRT